MSNGDPNEQIRELERALEELRGAVENISASMRERRAGPGEPSVPLVTGEVAIRTDLARTMLDRLTDSNSLTPQEQTDLKRLGESVLTERLRATTSRGAEVARQINITVTGNGTISVD